jgi:hypothetical protein
MEGEVEVTEKKLRQTIYILSDERQGVWSYDPTKGWIDGVALSGHNYLGTISDVSEIKDTSLIGYYVVKKPIYGYDFGIPNVNGDRKVYTWDGNLWKELGKDIIDVLELPTENVDSSKIYRTTEEVEPVIWIAGTMDGEKNSMSFVDFYVMQGINASIPVHLVETIPEADAMEPMDAATFTMPCYVVKSTGVAYICVNSQVVTIGQAMDATDGGWADSSNDIVVSSDGMFIYTIRGGKQTVYGVPNSNTDKKLYQYDGDWKNVNAELKQLNSTNISLNNTVAELNNEMLVKEDKITELTNLTNETEPYANFCKYATVSYYENINELGFSSFTLNDSFTRVNVKVPNFVTRVLNGACRENESIKNIELPENLISIGSYAFKDSKCSTISIPSATEIGSQVFDGCNLYASNDNNEFRLPSNLTTIGYAAFRSAFSKYTYGEAIKHLIIPQGVLRIEDECFASNPSLISVTFEGTPNWFSNSIFDGCENITDIYVPWPESHFSDAPWGATNATIHYNHVIE